MVEHLFRNKCTLHDWYNTWYMKHILAIKYLSMPDTNAHEFLFLSQYYNDKCRNKSNRNAQMLVQFQASSWWCVSFSTPSVFVTTVLTDWIRWNLYIISICVLSGGNAVDDNHIASAHTESFFFICDLCLFFHLTKSNSEIVGGWLE